MRAGIAFASVLLSIAVLSLPAPAGAAPAAAQAGSQAGAAQPKTAQTLTVNYAEGDVSVAAGGSWKAVVLGDQLAQDATLRIGPNSLLELGMIGARLTLSQGGTYALKDIIAASRAAGKAKAASALSRYLSALSGPKVTNQATGAGVRGAEQGESQADGWVASDAEVYIEAGKDFLSSGDYAAAAAQFDLALEGADDEELAEIQFCQADAKALSGDVTGAFQDLAGLSPSGSEAWAPEYVLLKARLLEDSFAPKVAVDLLLSSKGLAGDSKRAPLYYFLLALGYKGAGDQGNANQSLQRLTSLAGDSDLAKTAAELIRTP